MSINVYFCKCQQHTPGKHIRKNDFLEKNEKARRSPCLSHETVREENPYRKHSPEISEQPRRRLAPKANSSRTRHGRRDVGSLPQSRQKQHQLALPRCLRFLEDDFSRVLAVSTAMPSWSAASVTESPCISRRQNAISAGVRPARAFNTDRSGVSAVGTSSVTRTSTSRRGGRRYDVLDGATIAGSAVITTCHAPEDVRKNSFASSAFIPLESLSRVDAN